MKLIEPTGDAAFGAAVLESLADGRRRQVLDALLGQSVPLAVADLAAHLAGGASTGAPDGRALRTELVHVHLPKLAEAGLVAWDREAGTVAATDHPAFEHPEFRWLVGRSGDDWDDVVDCLADGRRRAVLAVLGEREEPVARRALARAVAAREAGGEPTPEAIEEVRVALHHVHLPKLADAGLVADDDGEVTIECLDGTEPWTGWNGDASETPCEFEPVAEYCCDD